MRSMVEQSGYAGARRSPVGIGGAMAVHAIVVGAILLMPKEIIDRIPPGVLTIHSVPADPPKPEPQPQQEARHDTQRKAVEQAPYVPDLRVPDLSDGNPITLGDPFDPGLQGPKDPPVIAAPVLTDPSADPRYMRDFQPDYPPAMLRTQEEGKVTVRLRIGVDGRVLAVERLSATNDAFWDATERQALKKWRFRPATRNGVPVEGTKVLTVHFRLVS